MQKTVAFLVKGTPATQGSKRAIYIPKIKRAIVKEDCERNAPWRSDVRDAAEKAWPFPPCSGPVKLRLRFFFKRPRGHFGSGKTKDPAPAADDGAEEAGGAA